MRIRPRAGVAAILIVEDEQAIASRLAVAVKEGGWHLIGPIAGLREAIDLLAHEPVAAAVLDFIVDGERVDPLIEELSRRGIPFAITTGITGRDAAKQRFGGAPIIVKPFQNAYVTEVIKQLLTV